MAVLNFKCFLLFGRLWKEDDNFITPPKVKFYGVFFLHLRVIILQSIQRFMLAKMFKLKTKLSSGYTDYFYFSNTAMNVALVFDLHVPCKKKTNKKNNCRLCGKYMYKSNILVRQKYLQNLYICGIYSRWYNILCLFQRTHLWKSASDMVQTIFSQIFHKTGSFGPKSS